MHPSALRNCKHFFDTYASAFADGQKVRIVEIGSQDVNGSLRDLAPANFEYIGVDFAEGKGVDVILEDPYNLPFDTSSVDIVLSSSCFEHSEMFWLVFLEIMRILKPKGLFYLNVPSNGPIHRYPVDCWRFYPDSAGALVSWAKRNAINAALLESYTSVQGIGGDDVYNDFVGIFLKDEAHIDSFPSRILNAKSDISNGILSGNNYFVKQNEIPEDMRKLILISQVISGQISKDILYDSKYLTAEPESSEETRKLLFIWRVLSGEIQTA